jgi:DHA1 family bicyclomycin/chloramphenicol resistance-like MFS transporter
MPKPDLPDTPISETPHAPMALLVMLMVTSQVAITIFLPSLPSMAGDLGTSQALVQMTVSAYLGAFAIAQLVVGPISDAIGRRKPLLAGLVLFTLASIACALAPSIDLLIGARMVQAIGGCACLVIARAIVRDTSDGPAATRAMAYLGMSLAVAPMLAPLIGGQLETNFGWQFSFLFTALLGGLSLIITFMSFVETLPPHARRFTNTAALAKTYLRLFAMGKFMGYSFNTAAMGAAFQAFLAGAPFALIVVMGVPPEQLGYFIMAVPAGYIVGNFISSRMSRMASRRRMIWLGGTLAVAGTAVLLILPLTGVDSPYTLIAPLFFYSVGSGFVVPNSLAGAITAVEPAAAGSAAALGGFVQMGGGFVSTIVMASLIQTSFLQVGAVMFGCTLLSLLFFVVLVVPRPQAATD